MLGHCRLPPCFRPGDKLEATDGSLATQEGGSTDGLLRAIEWDDVPGATKFAEGLETHEAMEWATAGTWSRVRVVEELFEVDA